MTQTNQIDARTRREFLRTLTAATGLAVAGVSGTARAEDKITKAAAPAPDDKFRSMGYIELLNKCYKDELWGSRFFDLVVGMRPMAGREQALLGVLVVMENSMQGHLAYLLKRHAQQWDARAYAAEADAFAASLAPHFGRLPWQEFNAGFEAAVPAYLSKYKILRDKAPAPDREIMDLFVEHEQGYLDLAKMEQVTRNEASLAPIWRALEKSQRIAYATGRPT